jgi:hypothetical protein
MGSGGGGGGQNTVTQVQSVPEYIQAESQANQNLANSIASQPYPTYGGQLIANLTPYQTAGINMAVNDSSNYAPYLQNASNLSSAVNPVGASQPYLNQGMAQIGAANNNFYAGAGQIGQGAAELGWTAPAVAAAQGLTNPGAVSQFMSPYIQASLAPQLSDLQIAQAQNQNLINSQATQAGAFGDARQGAQSALSNYYNQQAVNQLTGTAYQNAFSAANQALGQAENTQLGAAQTINQLGGEYANLANVYGNLGAGFNQGAQLSNLLANTGLQQQQGVLNQAQFEAGLGSLDQQLGLNAANATYGAGAEWQQQQQTELNTAYQNYLNQVNWPYQQLNVRESAISNNPYNILSATTLPAANTTAQGFGLATSLAGLANTLGGKSTI